MRALFTYSQLGFPTTITYTPVDSAVIVAVDASAPKVYPRVTLASASTLSGSVVRTLSSGEGRVCEEIYSSIYK